MTEAESVTEHDNGILLALKMEEGITAKEIKRPLEADKGKKIDCLLEPLEGTSPC